MRQLKPYILVMPLIAAALLLARPGFSFVPLITAGNADAWSLSSFPIQWNINPSIGSNITGATGVATVITNSFATWMSAPNTSLPVSRGPDSTATQEGSSPSDINLICFVCNDVSFGGAETLAETISTIADAAGEDDFHGGTTQFAGQIIKADIAFNPAVQFDTGGGTGQDLQTVATHEIGHFFGLDHSGVARAVMFPFAPNLLVTLSYDDVAGISTLYPKSTPDVLTGSLSGTVLMSGSGVFGAHVFTNSTTSASPFSGFSSIRKSPIGTLTFTDGTYTINAVPADTYVVIAEPLDLPVSDSDVSWASAFGQSGVQTNFTTRWH
ncbi:MAG TPA: matrixin family metalloprotease [Terriglobales bacterium]|jgi:hypothetical protein